MVGVVEQTVAAAAAAHTSAHPEAPLRAARSEPQTLWHKLDHLLYLPILGLERPMDLYYYQEAGLKVLYGFTYKYHSLEHFLGEMAHLAVGYPLADALARCYQEAWYPGGEPLPIFIDWHTKPHWTKYEAHSNHIAMWGRVMPGTKQLAVTGPGGHLLWVANAPVDSHFNDVLVDLEEALAKKLARPISLSTFDGEGSGLPMALRYAAAGRAYLSVVAGGWQYSLDEFLVLGEWEPVVGDAQHEAADALWRDPAKRKAEVRRLVLMRRRCDPQPTRIYAGRIPAELSPGMVPGRYRERWMAQERVFREMVNGANLNANYGYTAQLVPNRTMQRRYEEAQARVEASERLQAWDREAIGNWQRQLLALRQQRSRESDELQKRLEIEETDLKRRESAGLSTRACQRRLEAIRRRLEQATARYQQRRHQLLGWIAERRQRYRETGKQLVERRTTRDAIDTTTLCRERDLQKDQVMLDLQVVLTSLHDWARQHYFAPEWAHLELDTATKLIYRKAGVVTWGKEEISVELEPYRYPEQQEAMEQTCARFNQAQLRWRDGRLIRIRVAPVPGFQSSRSTASVPR